MRPLRGPPPCDSRELMAAVRPHSLLQYQHRCGGAEFRVNFASRDELVSGSGRNVNCTLGNIRVELTMQDR